MTTVATMRLIGVVQNIPGVCTFVRPIFANDAGEICLQKIEDGIIRDWDFFHFDSTIIPIDFRISRKKDDLALVCCEYPGGHILIGDILSFARQLRDEPFLIESFKSLSPASYETFTDFLTYVSSLNLSEQKAEWFEKRKIDFSPKEISHPVQKVFPNFHANNDGLPVIVKRTRGSRRFSQLSPTYLKPDEIHRAVDISRSHFSARLQCESRLLLDDTQHAKQLVDQVFEIWAKHLHNAPAPSNFLASIRAIFRASLFQQLGSNRKKRNDVYCISERSPATFWLELSGPSAFSQVPWSSSQAQEYNLQFRKFKEFRSMSPEAACLIYWTYCDLLSLDDLSAASHMNQGAVLKLLNKWQPELSKLLNPHSTRSHSIYPNEYGHTAENLRWEETSFPIRSIRMSGINTLFVQNERHDELNNIGRMIDGVRDALGLREQRAIDSHQEITLSGLLAYHYFKDVH